MTNEERDLITRFIQRLGGAPAGGFAGTGGQVVPALPPIDPEADSLIADLFTRLPEARYRITQTAFVQEHALVEAQNRIQRLEWELQQAHQQAQQQAQLAPPQGASPWGQPAQPQQPPSRGLFGSLFGAGRQAPPPPPPQQGYQQGYAPPPPPPQYPPGYNPGMFQQRGSGFLGSALTTAAGVAGGMVAANALTSLFSGHQGFGGGFGGAAGGGFVPVPEASPWATPAGASPVADPYDAGGASKDAPDSSGWTNAEPNPDPNDWQPAPDQSAPEEPDSTGWTDPGSDTLDPGSSGDDWT